MPLGSLIGAGASIVGGLLGKQGQESANIANLKIARENRAWQERMSNTAYQRSAVDLDRAGLNRILAIGSPSSTPAGNVATMQNPNEPLSRGVQAAAMTAAQIAQIRAQTKLTQAQTQAIQPASEVGEGIGQVITSAKQRTKSLMDEWRARDKPTTSMRPSVKGQLERRHSAKLAASLEQRRRAADRQLKEVAASVGLSGKKVKPLLLQELRKMDLPEWWDDDQRIEWAVKNPNELAKFINRQRKR